MTADPTIYRRRRLVALVALLSVLALIFTIPQLFAAGPDASSGETTQAPTQDATPSEVTNCQPGVVVVEAFIGRESNLEALVNVPEGEDVFLWYEITNTGLVDCIFDVGTYATFFTISSGDQVYYTSRDCDRASDTKSPKILKANIVEKSAPGQWLKVYSSSDFQCSDANDRVPRGGAAYDLKVEVSGVISEKKRFYLF